MKKEIIGRNIKNYREIKGLTQAKLADMVGCGPSRIAMYETGKREPDIDTIQAIADALNVSICTLILSNPLSRDRMEIFSLVDSFPDEAIPLLFEQVQQFFANYPKASSPDLPSEPTET